MEEGGRLAHPLFLSKEKNSPEIKSNMPCLKKVPCRICRSSLHPWLIVKSQPFSSPLPLFLPWVRPSFPSSALAIESLPLSLLRVRICGAVTRVPLSAAAAAKPSESRRRRRGEKMVDASSPPPPSPFAAIQKATSVKANKCGRRRRRADEGRANGKRREFNNVLA